MHPPARDMPAFAISSALLALAIICPLLIKQTEAGGKGKGGRGHIIVQNEVKGNQVPVYMPIPIPIPMPVGPPPPPPPGAHPHHPHGFGQEEEGEGEVRKIYLLQPMPRMRPQPHLKGGGLMGPIQNHIHLSQHEHQAGKHRHAAGFGGAGGAHPQQQQISQEGDADVRPQEKHAGIKSASSDVKILPIVVIPPVAPMPPIQIPSSPSTQSTSNTHRLMFSPQFNNFLVTNDRTKRRHRHHSAARDSLAEYGGSVGGSMFRDNYIGRGRMARSRMSDGLSHQGASSGRSRDFDYGDFDYDTSQSSYGRSGDELAAAPQQPVRRRYYRITSSGPFPIQRRYQRQFSPQTRESSRLNSIRDIIEAHKASRFEDYDQIVNNDRDQQMDYVGGENESNGLSESQSARFARNQSPAGFEISLDDLSNQLAAADSQQQNRLQRMPSASNGQDLSSLYYEHGDLASSSSKLAGRAAGSLQGSAERDIFEEDQWRFDSVKSVKHVAAANATMTSVSNSTPSSSPIGVSKPGTKAVRRRGKLDAPGVEKSSSLK